MKYLELGYYVVVEHKICHDLLTFKGIRVMVSPVLAALAQGLRQRLFRRHIQASLLSDEQISIT